MVQGLLDQHKMEYLRQCRIIIALRQFCGLLVGLKVVRGLG
jgi:hypothetical protein